MREVFLAFFLLGGSVGHLASAATPEEVAGQALAEHIISATPEENSRVTGTLIIRSQDSRREIPIVCKVAATTTNWTTTYQTTATALTPAEQLAVIHTTNGPNQYLYAQAGETLKPVAPADASVPLAGSDFSLADLGLDFLHWPTQRRLKGEMRLGEPCYVLESIRPAGEIMRVKSYIDEQYDEPLIADAYDAQGHLIKEFSLHGSSFKKVNGQWRLEKMEIHNRKTHSQTELKFDLNK
jgi:hypothetical protein